MRAVKDSSVTCLVRNILRKSERGGNKIKPSDYANRLALVAKRRGAAVCRARQIGCLVEFPIHVRDAG
jgi:hypothetical protein